MMWVGGELKVGKQQSNATANTVLENHATALATLRARQPQQKPDVVVVKVGRCAAIKRKIEILEVH